MEELIELMINDHAKNKHHLNNILWYFQRIGIVAAIGIGAITIIRYGTHVSQISSVIIIFGVLLFLTSIILSAWVALDAWIRLLGYYKSLLLPNIIGLTLFLLSLIFVLAALSSVIPPNKALNTDSAKNAAPVS